MNNIIKKNIKLINISLYLTIFFTFMSPLHNIHGKSLIQIGFPFPYLTLKNSITQVPFLTIITSLNLLSLILNILFFHFIIYIISLLLKTFKINKLLKLLKNNRIISKLKIKENILYTSI